MMSWSKWSQTLRLYEGCTDFEAPRKSAAVFCHGSLRTMATVRSAAAAEVSAKETRKMVVFSGFMRTHQLQVCAGLVVMIMATVEALPFPAPRLENCLDTEQCCTPVPMASSAPTRFQFQPHLPMRVRQAAQHVDSEYIEKYQRAMELMRALPDSDGRSFKNQYKIHCLYCDNHLFVDSPDHPYPMEIHGGWLFFPWHRCFLYFFERILAKLIGDDTFTLPFWNWDNQSPDAGGNVVPRVWAEPRNLVTGSISTISSLYDEERPACAKTTTGIVNFQNYSACVEVDPTLNETAVRAANAHILWANMVAGGVTPLTFLGSPYRLGDLGAGGHGSIESNPHNLVHGWANMTAFKDSAADPLFYGHHANIDRLWELWKTLPGGARGDINDTDFLDTDFTFYDEDGAPVVISVAQSLNTDLLRYKYEEVSNPWVSDGAISEHAKAEVKFCNPRNSADEIERLLETAEPFQDGVNLTTNTVTFKLRRYPNTSLDLGEEVLEVQGLLDHNQVFVMTAFAFLPNGTSASSSYIGCAEYVGLIGYSPHVGMSPTIPPNRVWRIGIRRQLELMGHDHREWVVLTLSGAPINTGGMVLTSARITYVVE